jgi:hypothetical protein
MSQRTVTLELAGEHQLARDLVAGGVFVPGERLTLGEDCALVLRGRGEELVVTATVVWVDDRGTGLQLAGCDADMKQHIALLAQSASGQLPVVDEVTSDVTNEEAIDAAISAEIEAEISAQIEADIEILSAQTQPTRERAVGDGERAVDDGGSAGDGGYGAAEDVASEDSASDDEAASASTSTSTSTSGEDEESSEGPAGSAEERKIALNINERLRGLTLVQQLKVAQHGEVSERILLERMYGKNVWEALLRNPRITGPEVARIARMGALPRTLIEIIVGNGGWLQIPEIRRALLSNPRLGTDQILRVLRLLPKHELKLAGIQTAYPFAVRDVAKRMLREMAGG